MLTLSRPQRQIAATMVVLAAFVGPTAYIAATAWRIHQPGHLRQAEAELGRRLGLRVTLDAVRYPRPGVVAYRGVVLSLEDSGGAGPEIARAGAIRIRAHGRQSTLDADGLRVRGGLGPQHLVGRLTAALRRLGDEPGWESVSMLAPTCEIELGPDGPAFSLRDLAWTYQDSGEALRLSASYRIADGDGRDPRCELTLVRQPGGEAPRTTLTLRSAGGQPLPARVLDPFFRSVAWLGPRATVDGELTLEQAGSGTWEARFRGTLEEVDLGAVAARIAPGHRLAGRARIVVESARWAEQPGRGPGWVEAQGSVVSTTPGTVGSALLAALQGQLGFRLAEPLDPLAPPREFQALGLTFAIDPRGGIRIGGALDGRYQPDTVLVDARSFAPVAYAPTLPATVPGLIRTLAASDPERPDQMIPARLESLMIQRYLPAPTRDGAVHRAAVGP